jgi:parallel beta-helix repeat protein
MKASLTCSRAALAAVFTTCKVLCLCLITCLQAMPRIANAQVPGVWQKDPDSQVNPAAVVTSPVLPAPDVTLGSQDTTMAGIAAGAVVGMADTANDPPDPPSSSNTLFVDNTPSDGDCPPTPYMTIQAAVNASGPNDTIKVCPGTYVELVQIVGHNYDGLRLESLQPLAATIQWPAVPSLNHQLVHVNGADGVTIRGFIISGPFPFDGCSADRHEGVSFEDAFNGRLSHNHITLIRNSLPALWGCQEGDAVAIGQRLPSPPVVFGAPGSAQVDHNLIDRYQKNGVQAVNPTTFVDVHNNTITASTEPALQMIIASNGVVVFRQAAAAVEQNVVSGNKYTPFPLSTGISLAEGPAGSGKVNSNLVFNNDFGIETDTQTGLEISHNDVFNNVSDAITLCGDTTQGCGSADQIVVRKNDVTNNGGSGILLLGATSNLLKSNHVARNGPGPDTVDNTDGIRVDMNSTHNQILDNHMNKNIAYDCHDGSTGGGTAGTANTWTNDLGNTQNRTGLCQPNDEDEGEGENSDHDQMKFEASQSHPENGQMQYQDQSKSMNVQSVNGVRSITYDSACVGFVGDALVNGQSGYLYTFTACDLSVLGTGIGNFAITVTGPSEFLYQKSAVLTSGYVSIHLH